MNPVIAGELVGSGKLTSPRQFSLEFLNLDVDILRKRKPQLFLRKNHYNGIWPLFAEHQVKIF